MFDMKAPNQRSLSRKKPIGSMTVSGHKFLGSPISCGVVIIYLEYMNTISKDIKYLALKHVTITGSRYDPAPILLWYVVLMRKVGLKNDVKKCTENASYLKNLLRGAESV